MSVPVLISQLIMLPVLIIFTWIYLRSRPAGVPARNTPRFDAVVVAAAVLFSALGLIWVDNADTGGANGVWKSILSVITTFHIFPFVLCAGWWFRRRRFDRPPTPGT